jgi:hypothetical protein
MSIRKIIREELEGWEWVEEPSLIKGLLKQIQEEYPDIHYRWSDDGKVLMLVTSTYGISYEQGVAIYELGKFWRVGNFDCYFAGNRDRVLNLHMDFHYRFTTEQLFDHLEVRFSILHKNGKPPVKNPGHIST